MSEVTLDDALTGVGGPTPEIRLHRFFDPGDIESAELRERAQCGGPLTQRYVALLEDGKEAGYVGLDMLSERCVIYELWVLRSLRGQRVGTGILEAAEAIALAAGRRLLTVRPYPLDGSDLERLMGFYSARGYLPDPLEPDLLSKALLLKGRVPED